MGTQQIMLLVLSVIIVSISVVGAVGLFQLRAAKANRAAIIQDMHEISLKAVAYYKSPANLGGGDGNWDTVGFYTWCGYPISDNRRYILTTNGEILAQEQTNGSLIIKGWGTEIGYDGDNLINARLILIGPSGEFTFEILN